MMVRGQRTFETALLWCSLWVLTACAPGIPPTAATLPVATPTSMPPFTPSPATALPLPSPSAVSEIDVQMGYTYPRPDGNRYITGRGHIPAYEPLDLTLDGVPVWLVAAPLTDTALWVAVLKDGRVQAFTLVDGAVEPASITPGRLPPGMPPLLVVKNGEPSLLLPPEDGSTLTHPVLLPRSGLLAYVAQNGDLVLQQEGTEIARFAVNALPDARILVDERERLLLLSDATVLRYTHGVLGDRLEAASITLVETRPQPRIVTRIELPEPQIVEGIAPIWADLTGDGLREIVVTVSDGDQGARIVAFDEAGARVLTGPAIGRGQRWRDQLAVAPFGPDGAIELTDDLTPHIGGVAEFYRVGEGTLEIVAQVPGYSTHVLGSRNLGRALAGDFDGDGQVELLVPSQDRRHIAGIRRTADGAEIAWSVAIGGHLTTNLAAVALPDGNLALGVGRSDKTLRIWP